MKPKTFVLVEFNKHEFSFMAALYWYFMVQKKIPLYQSINLELK